MFCDDCQVWVHGAVYPNVYEVFKQFKYTPLPRVEDSFAFEEQAWKMLNAVKDYYFDIYSAKARGNMSPEKTLCRSKKRASGRRKLLYGN